MSFFGRKTPENVSFPERPTKKKESDDCVMEIKNTKQGRKLKISKSCSKEQIRAFAQQNNVDLNMED